MSPQAQAEIVTRIAESARREVEHYGNPAEDLARREELLLGRMWRFDQDLADKFGRDQIDELAPRFVLVRELSELVARFAWRGEVFELREHRELGWLITIRTDKTWNGLEETGNSGRFAPTMPAGRNAGARLKANLHRLATWLVEE